MSAPINPARLQFGKLLKDKISGKFKSRRSFAAVAEPSCDVDNANSLIGMVVTGKRTPPLQRIEAWADALEIIDPAERVDFFHKAVQATLKPDAVALLWKTQRLESSVAKEASA